MTCLLQLRNIIHNNFPVACLRETETSVRSINVKKWKFIRSPYPATWLDVNNKLSVASDHLSGHFDRTLTCDKTETRPCLVPH